MFNHDIRRDYTWNMQPADIWLSVEATLGIFCACMANAWPLNIWLLQRLRSAVRGERCARPDAGSDGRAASDRGKLPSYIEARLVLRPRGEDEIHLTTLATTVIDRDSDEDGRRGEGIVVRSEFVQVVSEGDERSDASTKTMTRNQH